MTAPAAHSTHSTPTASGTRSRHRPRRSAFDLDVVGRAMAL